MYPGTFILRLGLAIVFGYFSFSQFSDPAFFTSYIPSFLSANALALVYVNAVVDAIFCITLLFNILPRLFALLACIHLLSIAFFMGLNDVAVRDFGLAMACLALALIQEEHMSSRQKALLSHFLGKH